MSFQKSGPFGCSCWWTSRRVHGNNSFHDPVSIGYIKNSPANVQPASKTCRSDETKRADRAGLSRIPNGVTVLRPLNQISGESQDSRVNARMKLPRPLHEQTETQFSQLPLHFLFIGALLMISSRPSYKLRYRHRGLIVKDRNSQWTHHYLLAQTRGQRTTDIRQSEMPTITPMKREPMAVIEEQNYCTPHTVTLRHSKAITSRPVTVVHDDTPRLSISTLSTYWSQSNQSAGVVYTTPKIPPSCFIKLGALTTKRLVKETTICYVREIRGFASPILADAQIMTSPKATGPCPQLLGCAWTTKRRNIRRIIWRSFFKRPSSIETVPGYLRRRRKGIAGLPFRRDSRWINERLFGVLYWLLANQSAYDGTSEHLMDLRMSSEKLSGTRALAGKNLTIFPLMIFGLEQTLAGGMERPRMSDRRSTQPVKYLVNVSPVKASSGGASGSSIIELSVLEAINVSAASQAVCVCIGRGKHAYIDLAKDSVFARVVLLNMCVTGIRPPFRACFVISQRRVVGAANGSELSKLLFSRALEWWNSPARDEDPSLSWQQGDEFLRPGKQNRWKTKTRRDDDTWLPLLHPISCLVRVTRVTHAASILCNRKYPSLTARARIIFEKPSKLMSPDLYLYAQSKASAPASFHTSKAQRAVLAAPILSSNASAALDPSNKGSLTMTELTPVALIYSQRSGPPRFIVPNYANMLTAAPSPLYSRLMILACHCVRTVYCTVLLETHALYLGPFLDTCGAGS
ncbi:uncharacterized protein CLUP02_10264 [Colletotrichum lupini]|uniref:Uncharacterized protein n=1 Tax=Colletotrichum lupini TaxID=145971 RepID=A0A9Q8SX22_9PEZI|nr:uncharacterized protein CLUP02_10264 [Colletotrichum lupini]UQC84768.1 hypothetical protein CLUP02_10264 [Colletotrichum lupini]